MLFQINIKIAGKLQIMDSTVTTHIKSLHVDLSFFYYLGKQPIFGFWYDISIFFLEKFEYKIN